MGRERVASKLQFDYCAAYFENVYVVTVRASSNALTDDPDANVLICQSSSKISDNYCLTAARDLTKCVLQIEYKEVEMLKTGRNPELSISEAFLNIQSVLNHDASTFLALLIRFDL